MFQRWFSSQKKLSRGVVFWWGIWPSTYTLSRVVVRDTIFMWNLARNAGLCCRPTKQRVVAYPLATSQSMLEDILRLDKLMPTGREQGAGCSRVLTPRHRRVRQGCWFLRQHSPRRLLWCWHPQLESRFSAAERQEALRRRCGPYFRECAYLVLVGLTANLLLTPTKKLRVPCCGWQSKIDPSTHL